MTRIAVALFGCMMLVSPLLSVESHATGNDGLPPFKAADSASVTNAPVLEQLMAAAQKKKRKKCPAGQNRDPSTGICFSCSHNDHFENGECVPCKIGFHQEGDECVANVKKSKKTNKSCPAGTELVNGKCSKSEFPPIENCPEGQNPDPQTGVCFSCSHNDHFENGTCVPCVEGFHVEGDQCVAN